VCFASWRSYGSIKRLLWWDGRAGWIPRVNLLPARCKVGFSFFLLISLCPCELLFSCFLCSLISCLHLHHRLALHFIRGVENTVLGGHDR
jgi:hypothetical protein